MFKKLGNYLLAGTVILLPIAVTVFLLMFLVRHLGTPATDILVRPVLDAFDKALPNSQFGAAVLDCASTVLVLVLVAAIGALSRFFMARALIGLSERAINKIPGVGLVYRTVKQIVDTFSKNNKAVFQYAVLVEFPRRDAYSVGFVTGECGGEIGSKTGAEFVNVFVPTTPNPTSGFLMMIDKREITRLDMTVGEAMKLIISGGAVVPPWNAEKPSKGVASADKA